MRKIFNWVFASWTGHELEVDSKGVPFVFQKLLHTVGVEDVSTCKPHYGLSAKFTSETNVAEIVFRGKLLL